MRTFKQLARELAISLRGDVWWAELWSGMTALCWALFSLRYQHELAPSMQMPVRLGDAGIWQLLSFALGSAQLFILILNHKWLRWAAAMLMGWFWGVLTLGVWTTGPWAPGVVVYAGWCGINVFSILRQLQRSF